MAAGVSIIPDGLKHDGSVLRLSPNSKGSQHNEQARSFLRAGVRQLPCDHTTGESKSLMHKSVYQRFDFETGSVLLYDRIGEYRPDNVRIHVDLKHYLIGSTADPQCTADDIEQKWENAAALGDFRHATELCFSTDCGSSLHSPVPLLDATRPKVLLDASHPKAGSRRSCAGTARAARSRPVVALPECATSNANNGESRPDANAQGCRAG
jgi:hypothetical protein